MAKESLKASHPPALRLQMMKNICSIKPSVNIVGGGGGGRGMIVIACGAWCCMMCAVVDVVGREGAGYLLDLKGFRIFRIRKDFVSFGATVRAATITMLH